MTRNDKGRDERLAPDIRRQFGTETVARFARTLPLFRVETDIPERFRELLNRLDNSEPNTSAARR